MPTETGLEVVLVRHGATDWNVQGRCQGATDRELTEVGVRQAEAIAEQLAGETVHAVYSSDLKRARRTAELISAPHGLPVLVEEDIRELDHGDLEGLTFDEIKRIYPDFLARWRSEPAEVRVPGGERLADVAERAWNGLRRIVARHPAAPKIVMVSHNFPILGIVCRITGTPLNHYRSFHLDPCGVTRLSRDARGRWGITHVNSREYLPAPLNGRASG
jgi:broad specificity phosphatase PhoE